MQVDQYHDAKRQVLHQRMHVQVFLDVGLCPEGLRTDRTLGDPSAICTDPTPLGRVTLGTYMSFDLDTDVSMHQCRASHCSFCNTWCCFTGLYGKLVPQTVANFSSAIKAGIYTGTLWSKVLPGEYIQAGQQGSKRTGAVDIHLPESVLSRNQEVLSSKSFRSADQRAKQPLSQC